MNGPESIRDCVCEGQSDLLDLVGTEHIPGSMPAAAADLDAARDRFHTRMLAANTERDQSL